MKPKSLEWETCNIPSCRGHIKIHFDNDGNVIGEREVIQAAVQWLLLKLNSYDAMGDDLQHTRLKKMINYAFGLDDKKGGGA